VQLRCSVPLEVARARLTSRPREHEPSDATEEVLDAMTGHDDPWPQATTIRTGQPIDAVLAAAGRAVREQLGSALALGMP
jgi:predicted kinase